MTSTTPWASKKPSRSRDAGKVSVSYVKVNDRQFIELIPRTSDSQPGGILHTCFEVADIESLHKAYVAAGLQPTDPKKARAGNLLFVMHGPDNQLLEYTQYLPDSLHSQDHGKHLSPRRISTHMLATTTAAKDLAAERSYYTGKLDFKSAGSDGNKMYIAGKSGDQVELQADTPDAKPRVTFAVSNLRQTAHDLRSRGLKVQKSASCCFSYRSRRHCHSICYICVAFRLDMTCQFRPDSLEAPRETLRSAFYSSLLPVRCLRNHRACPKFLIVPFPGF